MAYRYVLPVPKYSMCSIMFFLIFVQTSRYYYYTYNFLLNSAEGVSGVPPSPPSLKKSKEKLIYITMQNFLEISPQKS